MARRLSPAEKAARTRARNALVRERAALERFQRWRQERIHWERERERIQALPPAMRIGVKLRPPPAPLELRREPVPVEVPPPSYQPPGGPPGSVPVPLQGSPIQGEGDTLTLAVLLWWQDWTRTTLAAMGKAPVVSIQAPNGQLLQVPEDIARKGPGAVIAWVKGELGEGARVNGAWVATTTGTQKKASPPKRVAVAAPTTEGPLPGQPDNDDEGAEDEDEA